MLQSLTIALLATQGATQLDAFEKYDRNTLERMVYVRGLSCDSCSTKQIRNMARENAVRCPP